MSLLNVHFYAETLGMSTQMSVILPEHGQPHSPGETARRDGTIPTLYLLHGIGDDHTAWQRYTSIERYAAQKQLAVVMPATYFGWYTDMYRGYDYFTYIARELPEICRAMFPMLSQKREDTWAAGASMGGYGALKMGLRAGETFSRVASLSGPLDVCGVARNTDKENELFREDVFGPAEKAAGSLNDLFQAAEDSKDSPWKPDVYIWCGTEDVLYRQNTRMRDHLRGLGYQLTYGESAGDRQWEAWDEEIQAVLHWLLSKKDAE